MSWDRPKYEAALSISTDISTPNYCGSESPLGMHPNIAFNGTPSGWELLVQWGFLTAAPSHGELLPSSAGINLRNHSLIYLLLFFHFMTTGHPTGLVGSCKIPINHANILLLLSLPPCPFSLHSSTINTAKWIFFFLNLQGKMTNFACRLRTHASFQLEWISTTFLNPQTRTCPFPQ